RPPPESHRTVPHPPSPGCTPPPPPDKPLYPPRSLASLSALPIRWLRCTDRRPVVAGCSEKRTSPPPIPCRYFPKRKSYDGRTTALARSPMSTPPQPRSPRRRLPRIPRPYPLCSDRIQRSIPTYPVHCAHLRE